MYSFDTICMVQIIKETENIWEYTVGINAIIANFVFL